VPGHIQTVQRAAAILTALSERTRLGVADLAEELGLPKGTVRGLLRTLQAQGLVEHERETGSFRLGAALLTMGSSYLEGNELRQRSFGWADGLAARTRADVWIGTPHDARVLIVHHAATSPNGRHAVAIGLLLPVHATAMGKVLLAGGPHLRAAVQRAGLCAYTEATITDPARLDRELARVREQGWGLAIGELTDDQVSIAAPIGDRLNPAVGAIAISGPAGRLLRAGVPRPDLLDRLRDAAGGLSRELGAPGWRGRRA